MTLNTYVLNENRIFGQNQNIIDINQMFDLNIAYYSKKTCILIIKFVALF